MIDVEFNAYGDPYIPCEECNGFWFFGSECFQCETPLDPELVRRRDFIAKMQDLDHRGFLRFSEPGYFYTGYP